MVLKRRVLSSHRKKLSWSKRNILKYQYTIPKKCLKFHSSLKVHHLSAAIHYVKSVQIWSYFWSVFSCIQSEYRKIRNRNNSVFGHFTRSRQVHITAIWDPKITTTNCPAFLQKKPCSRLHNNLRQSTHCSILDLKIPWKLNI